MDDDDDDDAAAAAAAAAACSLPPRLVPAENGGRTSRGTRDRVCTQSSSVGGFRNQTLQAGTTCLESVRHAIPSYRLLVRSPFCFFRRLVSGRRWVPTPLANGSPTRQSCRETLKGQSSPPLPAARLSPVSGS
ncbi:hypothetical protein CDD80_3193 [Ophiocordyceps camponoti-rufipedis]|uniref:Uncharacterized protein n=1 Tax=Ophiocordyceps camponoti-rufipedis TaxID=2004952 RepID=A0A2C5Z3A0_9HYPO|nr:hypothetical protein CDD80_3193 [Ophiocordyceps camponoti-rufipedis]